MMLTSVLKALWNFESNTYFGENLRSPCAVRFVQSCLFLPELLAFRLSKEHN